MAGGRSAHYRYPTVQAASSEPDTGVWLPGPAVWSRFSCKRKPFTCNSGGFKCDGGARWPVRRRPGASGTQSPLSKAGSLNTRTEARGPAPISPPGLVWPLLAGPGPAQLHPILLLQLFPPTQRALTSSQALPEGAFPSPAEGPLGPRAPAHPFPVPPQLRPHSGWKVSLKIGGSFSFLPGGRARTDQSEGGG